MSDFEPPRQAILALEGPVFAVLDGAQSENLPQTLMLAGIEARCLYLDRGDNHPERLVTAPYMVGPLDDAMVDKILSILPQTSAAVFWECNAGGDALYRHLRSLNMVLVPNETEVATPLSYEGSLSTGEAEPAAEDPLVLFRHADANVIAQVLPTLDAAQRRRFFGPAVAVLSYPARRWSGESPNSHLDREPEGGLRPSGPLRLNRRNISGIAEARWRSLEHKVAEQLRRIAPERTRALDERSFNVFVQGSLEQSRQFGVQTDSGHFRWAYMSLVTRGKLGDNPDVKAAMHADAPGYSADMRVAMLMRYAIASMKDGANLGRNA